MNRLPENFWEFMGFAIQYGPQAIIAAMVAWGLFQNKQQLTKQDMMREQLNGATQLAVQVAKAAGIDEGKLEGAATEQARAEKVAEEAAQVAQNIAKLKSHSGD